MQQFLADGRRHSPPSIWVFLIYSCLSLSLVVAPSFAQSILDDTLPPTFSEESIPEESEQPDPTSDPQQEEPLLPVPPAAPVVPGESEASDPSTEAEGPDAYLMAEVFVRALQLIRQDYVDGERVSHEELTYNALRGMLSALDPHSQFMAPDELKRMQEDARDAFGGLGIRVEMRGGILTVVSPMENAPGARAGLLPGDQIVEIDGTTTDRLSLQDAVQKLRGPVGDPVVIRVFRPSNQEFDRIELVREIIRTPSVPEARLLEAGRTGPFKIAYIRITQFNEPTAEEFSTKLRELREQGLQALILDLRDNPGGLLNTAVEMLKEFLPPNEMVVYTEGRTASQERVYRTPSAYRANPWFPAVVLINNGSASASEIVAGALKDLNRALVMGETTFGKGSVQTVIPLVDGSAVRLTTAKYYTPGRQVIHEVGITPTIRVTMTPEEEQAMRMRRNLEALNLSEEQLKSLESIADPQLDRAIDALKSSLVLQERQRAARE
ncbi:MAG: S41 family peptidase [Verrucomicrobiales bacterium]